MKSNRIVFVTGLALFAMFFGAGNLIIPVMIGVNAGTQSWVSAIGFIASGVLLPALSMIALATKHPEEERFADRLGAPVGFVLTTIIFLSCGMIYGIPRVGAVSFEFAAAPIVGIASWHCWPIRQDSSPWHIFLPAGLHRWCATSERG